MINKNQDGEKEMHSAVCSDCGKACQVPFKPTEGKPVRCLDCFKKSAPKKEYKSSERTLHNAKCSVCGKACQVPFKPKEGSSVSCKDCYTKSKNSNRN